MSDDICPAVPEAAVRCPAASNYPHFLDISGCSGTHHDQKIEQCRQQTWRQVLSDRYSDPVQQRWSRHHKVIKIVREEWWRWWRWSGRPQPPDPHHPRTQRDREPV